MSDNVIDLEQRRLQRLLDEDVDAMDLDELFEFFHRLEAERQYQERQKRRKE